MCYWGINDYRPQQAEKEDSAKFNPFDECPDYKGGGNNRKSHLKHEENRFWDIPGH